jgi:hypothetical protein
MQIGHATVGDIAGTLLFMLTLLLVFWSLTSWPEPPQELRRFRILITVLIIVSALLAEAGMIWLGWTPPWQEAGISAPPASPLDLIALPALAVFLPGLWFILSLTGCLPASGRLGFRFGRAALLGLACLLYETGMLFFGWPAPWHLPIPSE